MRVLAKHGSFVGGTGLFLLAATNTEMQIRDIMKRTCPDCGLPLKTHDIQGANVVCPDPDTMGNAK